LEDVQWHAVVKGPRSIGERTFWGLEFGPCSFAVGDDFNRGRGHKRGLSSWYHIYMEPIEQESVLLPMAKWALIVLLVELALVGLVRWRAGRRDED